MSSQLGNVEWVRWSSGPDNVWEKCPECGIWQRITEPQILCEKHAPPVPGSSDRTEGE